MNLLTKDILETILNFFPNIELYKYMRVSNTWNRLCEKLIFKRFELKNNVKKKSIYQSLEELENIYSLGKTFFLYRYLNSISYIFTFLIYAGCTYNNSG